MLKQSNLIYHSVLCYLPGQAGQHHSTHPSPSLLLILVSNTPLVKRSQLRIEIVTSSDREVKEERLCPATPGHASAVSESRVLGSIGVGWSRHLFPTPLRTTDPRNSSRAASRISYTRLSPGHLRCCFAHVLDTSWSRSLALTLRTYCTSALSYPQ